MPDVWEKAQIQHETEVIPHGHAACLIANFMRESNAKDSLLEREAGWVALQTFTDPAY